MHAGKPIRLPLNTITSPIHRLDPKIRIAILWTTAIAIGKIWGVNEPKGSAYTKRLQVYLPFAAIQYEDKDRFSENPFLLSLIIKSLL